jgi:hypothetical protein
MKLGMTQVNDGIVTCYNDKGFGFNHNTSSKKKKTLMCTQNHCPTK